MNIPVEILEQILLKCDGRTLQEARKVSDLVANLVEYLGKRTRLWEWCCKEEIPSRQLIEYQPLFKCYRSDKWEQMYSYWSAWEFGTIHILEPKFCQNNSIKKISCIASSRSCIAVGSEDGRLKLYTSHWDPIFEHREVVVRITKLSFIEDEGDPSQFISSNTIYLVASFQNGISIVSWDGYQKEHYDILDVKSHRIYDKFICIEKVGGRMSIMKIIKTDSGHIDLKEIWFTRIYSPSAITSYQMWKEKCTFLINGTISTLCYTHPSLTPMAEMTKEMAVAFYAPMMLNSLTTQILRDNIILNIYKNADTSFRSEDVIHDYLEIIILDANNTYSKKQFNAWELFWSDITCIYLYGNSFLVGTSCGTVYLYRVSNWKNFDLKNYICKRIVGKHPIIGMAVKEIEGERIFYVCSRFAVHEIVCFPPESS